MAAPHRLNLSAGAAAAGVALVLLLAKGWAWFATGSLTVAASLADTALDLVVSLANLGALIYAAKPPDRDHPFGHSSIEDIAALAQAAVVAGSAGLIAWGAVGRLMAPAPLRAETAGLAVMALAILLTAALVWWQRRVARRTGSRVVAADSLHYLGDLLPNLAAMAALAGSLLFGLTGLDPILALAAAALLLSGAWRIGGGAFAALMDREAPSGEIARIEAVAAGFPEIRGFHDLKTRTAGTRLFVQIHIELDGRQTLDEAHAVGARLRRAIVAELPRAEVIVHKDPV